MRFLLLSILLLTCGCTSMDHSTLISPSDSLYHDANNAYNQKKFSKAIGLYKEFLEIRPRSDLAVPAKLNMGMSHYYSGEYKQAYLTLTDIEIKDENIKEYVDGVLKICKAEAGDAIEAATQKELAVALEKGTGGQIQIQVIDAYIDDFGSVVLTGKTNRVLTVFVDNNKVSLDGNNMFTTSVSSWRKGKSISIVARDENGGLGEVNYFPDGEAPEEPTGLWATNTSENSAEIEWDENDENDIKGYRMFYGLKGSSKREVPEIIKETNHEIIGLQAYTEGANKTFEFFVRAVDKMNNESDDSNILEVTLP